MARIRTIKPGFFKHEALYDAERETGFPLRIAFAGLWTVADREGRFHWRPRTLKSDVLPHDDCDFGDVLKALLKFGFIEQYRTGGKTYGHIPSFRSHQRFNAHEPSSELPSPMHMHARAMEMHASAKTMHASMEGKGNKERNGKESTLDDAFETFWSACPKKIGKQKAKRLFDAAAKTASRETLTAAMVRYAASRAGQDEKFTLHPANWLAQERWQDDLPDAPVKSAPHESWNGHAETLIAEVGEGAFIGYFAQNPFAIGPPARLTLATAFLRDLIERKFSGALARAFGSVTLEVKA